MIRNFRSLQFGVLAALAAGIVQPALGHVEFSRNGAEFIAVSEDFALDVGCADSVLTFSSVVATPFADSKGGTESSTVDFFFELHCPGEGRLLYGSITGATLVRTGGVGGAGVMTWESAMGGLIETDGELWDRLAAEGLILQPPQEAEWSISAVSDDIAASLIAGADVFGESAFQPIPEPCAGDADGDREIDMRDLSIVLGNLGRVAEPKGDGHDHEHAHLPGDLDANGAVDMDDLQEVLANFHVACP